MIRARVSCIRMTPWARLKHTRHLSAPQPHAVNGDGGVLAIPLLDNFVEKKHRQLADKTEMTLDEALKMVKNTMNAVVEREISTGDSADIYIITPDGIKYERFELRKD